MVATSVKVAITGLLVCALPDFSLAALCSNWKIATECENNNDGGCGCIWRNATSLQWQTAMKEGGRGCYKGEDCGGMGITSIQDENNDSDEDEDDHCYEAAGNDEAVCKSFVGKCLWHPVKQACYSKVTQDGCFEYADHNETKCKDVGQKCSWNSTEQACHMSPPTKAVCDETLKDGVYFGCQDRTIKGRTCQKWTSQSPHKHERTPETRPNKGLGNHSYCRNPDGFMRIWCYTTDPGKRWEYCDPLKAIDVCYEGAGGDEDKCKKLMKASNCSWHAEKKVCHQPAKDDKCSDYDKETCKAATKQGEACVWEKGSCKTKGLKLSGRRRGSSGRRRRRTRRRSPSNGGSGKCSELDESKCKVDTKQGVACVWHESKKACERKDTQENGPYGQDLCYGQAAKETNQTEMLDQTKCKAATQEGKGCAWHEETKACFIPPQGGKDKCYEEQGTDKDKCKAAMREGRPCAWHSHRKFCFIPNDLVGTDECYEQAGSDADKCKAVMEQGLTCAWHDQTKACFIPPQGGTDKCFDELGTDEDKCKAARKEGRPCAWHTHRKFCFIPPKNQGKDECYEQAGSEEDKCKVVMKEGNACAWHEQTKACFIPPQGGKDKCYEEMGTDEAKCRTAWQAGKPCAWYVNRKFCALHPKLIGTDECYEQAGSNEDICKAVMKEGKACAWHAQTKACFMPPQGGKDKCYQEVGTDKDKCNAARKKGRPCAWHPRRKLCFMDPETDKCYQHAGNNKDRCKAAVASGKPCEWHSQEKTCVQKGDQGSGPQSTNIGPCSGSDEDKCMAAVEEGKPCAWHPQKKTCVQENGQGKGSQDAEKDRCYEHAGSDEGKCKTVMRQGKPCAWHEQKKACYQKNGSPKAGKAESQTQEQVVAVQLLVENVNYGKLMSQHLILQEFMTATKVAIAVQAGQDISPDYVGLRLSAGSVIVDAIIIPPAGHNAQTIARKIAKVDSDVAAAIRSVDGIADVSSGTIQVRTSKRPSLEQREKPLVAAAQAESANDDADTDNFGLIVGAVCAGFAILALTGVSAFLFKRLRSAEKQLATGNPMNQPVAMGNPTFDSEIQGNPVLNPFTSVSGGIVDLEGYGGNAVVGIPVRQSRIAPGEKPAEGKAYSTSFAPDEKPAEGKGYSTSFAPGETPAEGERPAEDKAHDFEIHVDSMISSSMLISTSVAPGGTPAEGEKPAEGEARSSSVVSSVVSSAVTSTSFALGETPAEGTTMCAEMSDIGQGQCPRRQQVPKSTDKTGTGTSHNEKSRRHTWSCAEGCIASTE